MPQPERASDSRPIRHAHWLLLLVTALAYAPALWGGFVWDDLQQVLANRLTGSLSNLPAIFATDVWSSAGVEVEDPPYYRPLFISSLAVDRALWGASAFGHHLQGLIWHLLATVAVFALAGRLLLPMQALVMASLFALHPVQSEAVAWISARGDPMAACFGTLAVLLLMDRRASPLKAGIGGLSLLAALLSKELGLLFVVLLGGLEFVRPRERGTAEEGASGALAARWLAASAAVALWLGLRSLAGVGASRAFDPARVAEVAIRLPEILGVYGRLIVWPDPLTTGRDLLELDESVGATVIGLGVLVIGAALALWRGGRLAFVGLLFASAAFIPTLLGLGATYNLGERYLYAPMIGIALAVAACMPERPAVLGGLAAVTILMVTLIGVRLPDWESPLSLAASEARDHPTSTTLTGHATALRAAGRRLAALERFEAALEHRPVNVFACAGAVETALALGDHHRARSVVDRSVRAGCTLEGRLAALHALVFAIGADWALAERSLAVALRDPGVDERLWRPVAIALAFRRGDREQASWLLSRSAPVHRVEILERAERLVWPLSELAAAD